jgi:hypothetical protein
MSFAITNNLLTSNIKTTDLRISPRNNNLDNPKDVPLVWSISKNAHIPS